MVPDETLPTLLQGHHRSIVEPIFGEAGGHIGPGASIMMALLHMIGHSAPENRTRPDRKPI